MFFRRKPLPVVTNDTYRRWLRAQRPPWLWFLQRSELEQEQAALLGDEHWRDIAVAIGYAVADPRAADATLSAAGDDPAAAGDAEASLALRIAEGLASKIIGRRPAAAPTVPAAAPLRPAPVTMAGMIERRSDYAHAQQTARNAGRRLFGREPDAAKGTA